MAKYADVLELALYNSVLSGVSLDGDEFFYTNPLRASAKFPTRFVGQEDAKDTLVYQIVVRATPFEPSLK